MIKEIDITNFEGLKFKPGERVKRPENMMYYAFSDPHTMKDMPEEEKKELESKLKIVSGTVIRVFKQESILMEGSFGPFYEVKMDDENDTKTYLEQGLAYEDEEKELAWFKEHDPEGYEKYLEEKKKEEEEANESIP